MESGSLDGNFHNYGGKSRWSSSRSIQYKLTKPFGQNNNVTAEYYSNRSENIGRDATVVDKTFNIINVIAMPNLAFFYK